MLFRESNKLSLLECRLEIYTTIWQYVGQVAFNEFRLPSDYISKNDPNVMRAIVTFKQAKILVNAISLEELTKKNKLIIDISTISAWNHSEMCYLKLDVFQSGTMHVEQRPFSQKYVQIKYFEASWPGARVAHRLEPLKGSMQAHMTKGSALMIRSSSTSMMMSGGGLKTTNSCCTI